MSMADEMWELLPAVYRRRDADSGDVLRALVAVIGEQADVIRDDIARLYDNWFIETCEDWAVPYIGDLVGAHAISPPGETPSAADRARLARVAPGRMLVANAIRWRRRKGAFSLIDQIVWDVTRWPSRAVEFGVGLAVNQDVRFANHRGGVAGLRDPRPLARLGGPGDTLPRGVEVRQADAARRPGRYGPGAVGVFVFRRAILPVTEADAASVDDEGSGMFTFDPLGRNVPLYHTAPSTGGSDAAPGTPGPITRDLLARRRADTDPAGPGWTVDPSLYGESGCIMIWAQQREGEHFHPVDASRIAPANLGRWRERPSGDTVAVDPETGRIAFAERSAPRRLRVSYAQAATGPIGAAGAPRASSAEVFDKVHVVAASRTEGHNDLRSALERWRKDETGSALIEFRDSATYDEDRLSIDLSRGDRRLVIRAAAGCRPVIRLSNREAGAMDGWRIRGGRDGQPGSPGSSVALEGLLIAERGVLVEDYAGALAIRHCTLIPGWGVDPEGRRRSEDGASLAFENCAGPVAIESSITGPIFVRLDEQIEAPLMFEIADSIIDAGEGREAFLSVDGVPYIDLRIRRSTVIGATTAHALTFAENTVFSEALEVARRQAGCARFCFIPRGSRTPRRFSCIPRPEEEAGATPVFVSRTYGAPGYGELAPGGHPDLRRGADDRGELGAYHDLFWPIREANLRAALAEYLPAGVSTGIIYLS